MELRIAEPAKEYILGQAQDAQEEILKALELIAERPVAGIYLPFPWSQGILGYTTPHYFITYREREGVIEVEGVTKTPTLEDVQRAMLRRFGLQ